ncbi:MAG: hypothetical protein ACSHW0_10670 [Thalassotalea sp.]
MKLISKVLITFPLALTFSNQLVAKPNTITLEEVKAAGALHSKYKKQQGQPIRTGPPEPDFVTFQAEI